ncbi:MAG: hypothetical protein HXY40_19545 [Chloroflexi bacterium]|nr:hypothetical protein [Chloroflexota bacterium]
MPVYISWDSPERDRVLFEFVGKWTGEEYFAARAQGIAMSDTVSHVVNVIVDISASSLFPSNMLSHFGSSIDKNPKNFEIAVIVSTSTFVAALTNVIAKLYAKRGMQFKVVRTLQAARAVFAAQKPQAA